MSKLIALVLLAAGLGLTILIPLVGILTMVAGAFGLAIVQEDDLKPLAQGRPARRR